MISTNEFRKGAKMEHKGDPYEIIDFQHVKIGRGGAIVRTKIRNLRTGSIVEEAFKGGEKFETPNLYEKNMQYLYNQGDMYFFMDTQNYEQFSLTAEQLGDSIKFIKENMEVRILYYHETPLTVQVPMFVELKIAKTDPGYKGDTASGSSKPATLETGLAVKVPFHLNEGDIIRVDTRTSEYMERVKS